MTCTFECVRHNVGCQATQNKKVLTVAGNSQIMNMQVVDYELMYKGRFVHCQAMLFVAFLHETAIYGLISVEDKKLEQNGKQGWLASGSACDSAST